MHWWCDGRHRGARFYHQREHYRMRMPMRKQEDICPEDGQCSTKQGCPADHKKEKEYMSWSYEGNDKATIPTRAREPFASRGRSTSEGVWKIHWRMKPCSIPLWRSWNISWADVNVPPYQISVIWYILTSSDQYRCRLRVNYTDILPIKMCGMICVMLW